MATVSPDPLPIEYDARLVEEAVMLRTAGHDEETAFRKGRNQIYAVHDVDKREREFREFHFEWFHRLGLGRTLVETLSEQPVVERGTRCCVIPAISVHDEGADLHALRDGLSSNDKVIVIKLRPQTLLHKSTLRPLLRHELMHVADMLDPGFGYEPQLPKSELGPTFDNLVRERYRVLWDTWIDGRLFRRGWANRSVLDKRLEEFAGTFCIFGSSIEEKFLELAEADLQTHGDLVAKAVDPGGSVPHSPGGIQRADPCPLCHFPSFDFVDGATGLSMEAREEISKDLPGWRPDDRLCRQCADLYEAREMSRAAESVLPRV